MIGQRSGRRGRVGFSGGQLAAIVAALALAGSVWAAPGDLDPTFGDGGVVTTAIGGSHAWAFAIVEQPDGRLVAGGRTYADLGNRTESNLAMARYRSDGSLDDGFGDGGTLVQRVGGGRYYSAYIGEGGLILQDDGKLVLAGFASAGGQTAQFALMRADAAGRLDADFGQQGTVRTAFEGGPATPAALLLRPDGRLLAAGSSYSQRDEMDPEDGRWEFSLARYRDDGRLDGGFSDDGRVRSSGVGNLDAFAQAMVALPAGDVVVGGFVRGPNEPFPEAGFMLARYSERGLLNRDFGEQGKVRHVVGDESAAYALAVAADGKLIAGGHTGDGEILDFALARFMPDGSVDRSFGTDGTGVTPVGSDRVALISALAIQADGRILAGGYAQRDGRLVFVVARYQTDGTLDASFGDGGIVETLFEGNAYARDMLIQRDGKLVVAGQSGRDRRFHFTLARYLLEGDEGCVGDCDGSGTVGIQELIAGVQQAIGGAPVEACFDRNGNGIVDINELIAAVASASRGCPVSHG